jgi:ABC-2 type transport system permease protein
MKRLGAIIFKELLLLRRDRAGLLVLFLMPAALVLIISLVQENVMQSIDSGEINILFVDMDQQSIGKAIKERLRKTGTIQVVQSLHGRQLEEKSALEAIAGGDYQLCIVVPEGITKAVRKNARKAVRNSLTSDQPQTINKAQLPALKIYFDPAALGAFRAAVRSSIEMVVLGIEINEKMKALSEMLPEYVRDNIEDAMGPMVSDDMMGDVPSLNLDWNETRLLYIREKTALRSDFISTPTSVQQNVPAWSLFGIFFIVLPIAGNLIKERQEGTGLRLLSMPVSYFTIISGKVLAYILVCLAQFGLILCIGKILLPLLGTPQLDMGSELGAVALVALAAILAATGYGIMLGTLVRTYEQASMFGPISVVIAAAIGGIMVPVYAMPKMMQQLSLLSPLGWGLDAFLELFVRGGNLKSVMPEIIALIGFFSGSLLVSWMAFFRGVRKGG